MNELENYYGKFCEDKRLTRKHGQVEYRTSMKYIHDYLKPGDRLLDIGAGTGILSLMLAQRTDAEQIDSVEIDEDAYEQYTEYFNEKWKKISFMADPARNKKFLKMITRVGL